MPPRTPKLAMARCVAPEFSFHWRSKSSAATAAFAICESVAGASADSSEMLTPAGDAEIRGECKFQQRRDRRIGCRMGVESRA